MLHYYARARERAHACAYTRTRMHVYTRVRSRVRESLEKSVDYLSRLW